MARVTFRAKTEKVFNMDGSLAYERIKVPVLRTIHCDMAAFRAHPRFGGIVNSDLFPNLLKRQARAKLALGDYSDHIRLDKIPDGVTVDRSGFLAEISFEV